MEGPERAQPVHLCLYRIVYKFCRVLWIWNGLSEPSLFTFVFTGLFTSLVRVLWTWKGLSKPSLFILCLYRIVYESCRVIWTRTGLSEPSLFTFVLIGMFTSLVGCFGHGRD